MDRVLSDRYELRRHVARGGMADIYQGVDRRLGREVAVKILRPELSADESYVDRFRDEARAAAQLNHPNVVSVFDWGDDSGDAYIVMEWVDGPTLRDMLRAESPLDARRAAGIGAGIAAALAYAHAKGVVHRDVKPSNVLLAPTGPKVADFGIAKMPDPRANTEPGVLLGTPSYLSPEQLEGKKADARSDVYSLGAVLFEMVTGRAPFVGDTPIEVAGQHLNSRPPRPSSINPAVPERFEDILSRALARYPEERYQSAEGLRAALVAFERDEPARQVGETTVAMASQDATRMMPAPEPAVLPPQRRRRSAEWWLLAFILVAAVVAVIIALLASNQSSSKTVTVPNVVGQTFADARRNLEALGLKVLAAPEPNNSVPITEVISQDPPANAKVDKGSTVTLAVSQGRSTTTTRRTPTTRRVVTTPVPTEPPTTEAPATTSPPTTSSSPIISVAP